MRNSSYRQVGSGRNAKKHSQNSAALGTFTIVDTFAGMGLMRLALERVGGRVVWANDLDPRKRELYVRRFGTGEFVLGDIAQVDAASVPTVDVLSASFPCVDLSLAGHRAGLAGRQSGAVWALLRLVEALGARKPPRMLLENVPALLSSHGGRDFVALCEALAALGYLLDGAVVDGKHFSPARRERLFLVGRLTTGAPDDRFRDGSHDASRSDLLGAATPTETRPKALLQAMRSTQARWQLRRLPALPACAQPLSALLDSVAADDVAWLPASVVADYLAKATGPHRARLDAMRASETLLVGAITRRTRKDGVHAEMPKDGLLPCLRCKGGGSSLPTVVIAGGGSLRLRRLLPSEAARLMGAADFPLDGVSATAAFDALGDAVQVDAAAWAAAYLLA